MSILFHDIIFGPIKSRRLGYSLGINLLPIDSKICTFNCIYCECGWNPDKILSTGFNKREDIYIALENRLIEIKENNEPIDILTFAGNGEPTLHPKFPDIIDDVISLRNKYFPEKKIAVLSNATTLGNINITEALKKIDLPILKLDSAIENTFRLINKPSDSFNFNEYINNLGNFKNNIIVQTMFLRGEINGHIVDNTTENELNKWIEVVKKLNPINVMIYSIDREPPAKKLIKIQPEELKKIAEILKTNYIPVQMAF
jgi:wyosine [tRNA(Phe)-imidazoG37] synthetase (radical SAM superfamily)